LSVAVQTCEKKKKRPAIVEKGRLRKSLQCKAMARRAIEGEGKKIIRQLPGNEKDKKLSVGISTKFTGGEKSKDCVREPVVRRRAGKLSKDKTANRCRGNLKSFPTRKVHV